MHVYFVRHGETELNVRGVHQSPGTPLTLRGFDQARTVGEYLRPMNPSLLVSSTYERSLQTARIIAKCVGIKLISNPLFREIERPSILANRSLYSFRTIWYLLLSVLHRNNPSWRYKDAENFTDIYNRVQKSFAYIEGLTEAHESIVIVSHSAYIHLMIAYMCHGQKLSLRELVTTLLNINMLDNTGVRHVEFVGPTAKGTCAWIPRP